MLCSILTSLAVFAALVGLVGWIVGFWAAARAIGYRGSQIMSTQVNALEPQGVATITEQPSM